MTPQAIHVHIKRLGSEKELEKLGKLINDKSPITHHYRNIMELTDTPTIYIPLLRALSKSHKIKILRHSDIEDGIWIAGKDSLVSYCSNIIYYIIKKIESQTRGGGNRKVQLINLYKERVFDRLIIRYKNQPYTDLLKEYISVAPLKNKKSL